jgi:hypothetical protein
MVLAPLVGVSVIAGAVDLHMRVMFSTQLSVYGGKSTYWLAGPLFVAMESLFVREVGLSEDVHDCS